jgi:hypothetical protein
LLGQVRRAERQKLRLLVAEVLRHAYTKRSEVSSH